MTQRNQPEANKWGLPDEVDTNDVPAETEAGVCEKNEAHGGEEKDEPVQQGENDTPDETGAGDGENNEPPRGGEEALQYEPVQQYAAEEDHAATTAADSPAPTRVQTELPDGGEPDAQLNNYSVEVLSLIHI